MQHLVRRRRAARRSCALASGRTPSRPRSSRCGRGSSGLRRAASGGAAAARRAASAPGPARCSRPRAGCERAKVDDPVAGGVGDEASRTFHSRGTVQSSTGVPDGHLVHLERDRVRRRSRRVCADAVAGDAAADRIQLRMALHLAGAALVLVQQRHPPRPLSRRWGNRSRRGPTRRSADYSSPWTGECSRGRATVTATAPRRDWKGPAVITVVVVTYNSAAHLPRLVDSLPDALAGVGEWTLHVVDNDSTDGTPALVEQLLPAAALTRVGANRGYATGINLAADQAPPDHHLLVLNPDVRLHPGCVAHLLHAVDLGAGIVVPKLLDDDGVLSPSLRREPSLTRAWAEALIGGRRLRASASLRWSPTRVATRRRVGRLGDRSGDADLGRCVARSAAGTSRSSSTPRRPTSPSGPATPASPFATCPTPSPCTSAASRTPRPAVERSSPPTGCADRAPSRRVRRLRSAPASCCRRGDPRRPIAAHRAALPRRLRRDRTSPLVAPSGPRPSSRGDRFHLLRRPGLVVPQPGPLRLPADAAGRRGPAGAVRQQPRACGCRSPGRSTQPRAGGSCARPRSIAKLVRRPLPDLPGFHVMTPAAAAVLRRPPRRAGVNAWLVRPQVRAGRAGARHRRRPAIGRDHPDGLGRGRADAPHAAWCSTAPTCTRRSPRRTGASSRRSRTQLLRDADRVLYVSHELMERGRRTSPATGPTSSTTASTSSTSRPDAPASSPRTSPRSPAPGSGSSAASTTTSSTCDLLRADRPRSYPDASLVLIGDATCSMDELAALPNVHWLGFRPYDRHPALRPRLRRRPHAVAATTSGSGTRTRSSSRSTSRSGCPVVSTDFPEVDATGTGARRRSARTTSRRWSAPRSPTAPDPGQLRASVLRLRLVGTGARADDGRRPRRVVADVRHRSVVRRFDGGRVDAEPLAGHGRRARATAAPTSGPLAAGPCGPGPHAGCRSSTWPARTSRWHSADGRWRPDLQRRDLQLPGAARASSDYPFRTHGDTEVVLAGLRASTAPRASSGCEGQFAFARPRPARRRDLRWSRDRLGVLPLYYYVDDQLRRVRLRDQGAPRRRCPARRGRRAPASTPTWRARVRPGAPHAVRGHPQAAARPSAASRRRRRRPTVDRVLATARPDPPRTWHARRRPSTLVDERAAATRSGGARSRTCRSAPTSAAGSTAA